MKFLRSGSLTLLKLLLVGLYFFLEADQLGSLLLQGALNVKFAVQVRQLHRDHQDSHYISALLQYLREFAARFHSYCLDDKANIPVGEPGCPLSTGVRGHNHSLVSLDGPRLLALDHDFHIHGIVPSVTFVVDTPEKPTDSFFNGQPFVSFKDKVTQPSSAIHHVNKNSFHSLWPVFIHAYHDCGQ